MLVNQVEVQSLIGCEMAPRSFRVFGDSFCKADELVDAEGLVLGLVSVEANPAKALIISQDGLISINQVVPLSTVVHPVEFHMSSLQGLFVWKQKVTTDALDTHNA